MRWRIQQCAAFKNCCVPSDGAKVFCYLSWLLSSFRSNRLKMAVVEASYALSLARGQGVCIFSVLFFIEKLGFLCVCACSLCCIAGIPCQLNSVACHKALYRTSDQGHCFVWVLYWENCFLAFLSHSLSAYGCRLVSVRFTIDRAGQKICDHLRLFFVLFFTPAHLSQLWKFLQAYRVITKCSRE